VTSLQRIVDATLIQPNITGDGSLYGLTDPNFHWSIYLVDQL
jgi:hypothetical protein